MTGDPPVWTSEQAALLINQSVLIGITFVHGETSSHEQMFGTIMEADPDRGVRVALGGSRAGEDYWLPPDPCNFVSADPGEYRLRSSGEVVANPDLLSTWVIEQPA